MNPKSTQTRIQTLLSAESEAYGSKFQNLQQILIQVSARWKKFWGRNSHILATYGESHLHFVMRPSSETRESCAAKLEMRKTLLRIKVCTIELYGSIYVGKSPIYNTQLNFESSESGARIVFFMRLLPGRFQWLGTLQSGWESRLKSSWRCTARMILGELPS